MKPRRPMAATWAVACAVVLLTLGGVGCGRREEKATTRSSSRALGSTTPLVSTIGYRSDGSVSSRSLVNGTTVVASQTYAASPAGISTREDRVGGTIPEQHYQMNTLGRLLCVTTDETTSCPGDATSALPTAVRAVAFYSDVYSGHKLTNLRRRIDGTIANTRLEYDNWSANRPSRIVVSQGDCGSSSCETSSTVAYDVRGNRTAETPSSGQGAGSISRGFTYGPDNRVRNIRVASPSVPDANCAPTQWDQIDTDVGYDPHGMIAFRRQRIGSTTQQTVRYSRTRSGEIGYSLQAGATATQRVTYKYLHLAGHRTVAVRETWDGTQRTSRKYLFFHSDRHGSPMVAFGTDHPDDQGTQQWSADRDPWGWTKITSAFSSDEIPFEFPGQVRLDGTEVKRLVAGTGGCEAQVIQPAIVSNGFRDYDPGAGIYLSRDPIALVGAGWAGSSANRNLYAYAGFNPVDRTDYWGLEAPGLVESILPIWGPKRGMEDAIENGQWGWAAINATFLVADLLSLGTAAIVRDAVTGLARGAGNAEVRILGRATCEGARGAEETRTLYRAVKDGELADIGAEGRYRAAPGQTEGKYFFETPEQASNFARMIGDEPYTTTSVHVSPAEMSRGQPVNPAKEGPGYFFETPYIPRGPVNIFNFSVVP